MIRHNACAQWQIPSFIMKLHIFRVVMIDWLNSFISVTVQDKFTYDSWYENIKMFARKIAVFVIIIILQLNSVSLHMQRTPPLGRQCGFSFLEASSPVKKTP